MSRIVEQLQNVFGDDNPAQIRAAVDTVERFQGQERDVIVASFGIGDADLIRAGDEFLFSLRRFNALASRARAKLIVLAPKSLIEYLPNEAAVLSQAHLLKGYVQNYCNLVAALDLPCLDEDAPATRNGLLYQRHSVNPTAASTLARTTITNKRLDKLLALILPNRMKCLTTTIRKKQRN